MNFINTHRRRDYAHSGDLKKRSWTESMIRDFLGEPDGIMKNHYAGGRPVRMFLMTRVIEAETQPEWRRRVKLANKRRSAAKLARCPALRVCP
ncbi:hypothetical protein [Primorskyibacter sp. S87]|uniref:hypothetical protein n=1 Tax=Primorskyibacter sp. S87 TaxID=3415126 RepID=UPI003C7B03C4